MKRGFKKIAAAILTAALVFTLLSAVAWADDLPSGVTWNGDSTACTYDGSTITITGSGMLTVSSDVTISGGITVSSGTVEIVVSEGATLTSTSGHTVYIASGAEVTLSGGTYKCTANDSSNAKKGVVVNYGTCTINSGTYYNSSSANKAWYTIVNSDNGTMTINGGTFNGDASSSGSSLVRNVGVYDEDGDSTYDSTTCTATLTINGGTFGYSNNNKYAVKNDLCGTLVINGGTFYGSNQSVQNWSKATINGGTFEAHVISWSGNYTLEYSSTLTINDGTFESDVRSVQNYNSTDATSSVTIYGGTFNGAVCIDVYNGSKSHSSYASENSENYSSSITIYHGDFTYVDSSGNAIDISGFVATDVISVTVNGETVSVDAVITVSETSDDGTTTTTAVHALAKVEAVDATCTIDGNIEYYYCVYDCDAPYFIAETDEDGNVTYKATTLAAVTIEAEHSWDYDNPSITWSNDYSTVTIVYTCTVCGETFTVTDYVITSVENEDGSITYTAMYTGPDGGNYETDVTVTGSSTAAATGDPGIALWIVLIALAGCGAIGFGLKRRFE